MKVDRKFNEFDQMNIICKHIKIKNVGLGSRGAFHGSSKDPKATKLASKWVSTGYILLYLLKSKWLKPQMAWNQ
jgi:hypothetical protein